MAALAIGLVWMGYSLGLYGYCLFKGYDVTPKLLMNPQWPAGAPKVPGEEGKQPSAPKKGN